MKKLQSNFTTQEQSKLLLELGVPEWTADCFYKLDLYSFKTKMCFTKEDSLLHHYTPCWSVGRLIEVYLICTGAVSTWCSFLNGSSTIEHILEYRILPALKDGHMDFSKLDE